ncbi:MAG: hypothetical protein ABSD29_13895 [Verrucomicrobiota bacterium]|jgi:hypothetical protein
MGLTIYYTLSLKEEVSASVVRELVRRTALYARKIGCADVSRLLRAEKREDLAPLFIYLGEPKGSFCTWVTPERGWLVRVWPGAGCETATFGVCQYPRRILYGEGYVSTGFHGGWRFSGFCKTQYAGVHGWENFLQCHLRVISLLDFWRGLGARVKVNDEGGFWKARSVEKLREELRGYDRLVAAMSGMLKDADGDLPVKSPIFDYKDFERLEHEGWQEFGGRIERLRETLSQIRVQ